MIRKTNAVTVNTEIRALTDTELEAVGGGYINDNSCISSIAVKVTSGLPVSPPTDPFARYHIGTFLPS